MKIFRSAIALASCVTSLTAQWLQYSTPGIPRTADGKPNLTAPTPGTVDSKPDYDGAVGNRHRWGGAAISGNAISGTSRPPTFSLGRKRW